MERNLHSVVEVAMNPVRTKVERHLDRIIELTDLINAGQRVLHKKEFPEKLEEADGDSKSRFSEREREYVALSTYLEAMKKGVPKDLAETWRKKPHELVAHGHIFLLEKSAEVAAKILHDKKD